VVRSTTGAALGRDLRTALRRLILLVATLFVLLCVVAFSLAFYRGDPAKPSAIAALAVAIFAIALILGFAGLGVRLVRSYMRSSELRRRIPEAQVVVSLLWSKPPWTRAAERARHPIKRLGTALFSTVGMSADSNGLQFWTGVRNPTVIREVRWLSVIAIQASPVLLNGKRYPFLELVLREDKRLLAQVESVGRFSPIAKLHELSQIVVKLDEVRTSAPPDDGPPDHRA